MINTFIILPNTLFKEVKVAKKYILYEHPIYFTDFKFHKLKLILHRASMKSYSDYLRDKFPQSLIEYIEYDQEFLVLSDATAWDPIDLHTLEWLTSMNAKILESPMFIETHSDLQDYYTGLSEKQRMNMLQTSFYIHQRKTLGILVDKNLQPTGGSWTYDIHNRKPFTAKYSIPKMPGLIDNAYIQEAKLYISKRFSKNPGQTDFTVYPIDHSGARKLLEQFIHEKLDTFGDYEDAVNTEIPIGSHSLLSSSMNIGLITPREVVDTVLARLTKKNLNSVEGFIRQVIGWRSFVRFVYLFGGGRELIKDNYLQAQRNLPKGLYTGSTGLFPIDYMVDKTLKLGYLHHIERLMWIGNYTLLLGVNPQQVYMWFMEMFIDSYEWVMVANVQGMSQYAFERIKMSTRPYFSAASYIIKMSDFTPLRCPVEPRTGLTWDQVWNSLYYSFINKHSGWLGKIYATARNLAHWTKKTPTEKQRVLKIAKLYLNDEN